MDVNSVGVMMNPDLVSSDWPQGARINTYDGKKRITERERLEIDVMEECLLTGQYPETDDEWFEFLNKKAGTIIPSHDKLYKKKARKKERERAKRKREQAIGGR